MIRVCSSMRARAAAILLLCLALLWPSLADAQATPGSRVLVMPFVVTADPGAPGAAGAALWMGEAASILLVERLSTLGVGALSRDQRVRAFDRLNVPMSPALTHATTMRVAELIGASEVVFGEVELGTELRVHARLVQVGAGRELPELTESGPLDDIFAVFSRVASGLAGRTGRVQPPAASPLAPLPLEVFEAYVKGLVAATPAGQQRFLESAVRAAPTDGRILMALWSVYSAQGMHERALASASTVSPQSPLARNARFAVALSLIELERFDGAFQTLATLYQAGKSAALSNALGVVQLRRAATAGNPPATYFKRATEEDPQNTDYLFNLGYALARAGNRSEALNWLREVVRLDAADGDAHRVMAAVLRQSGQDAEADRELELARLLGAATEEAVAPAARALPDGLERLPSSPDLNAGPRLTVAIANPAQRDQRETAIFHLSNGKTAIAEGRDRQAVDELRRAVYLDPYADEPHLLLGQLYTRTGQLDQAIDELKIAVWCRESAPARLALARALIEAGELDAARREIDRARVLAPNSTEAEELLKRLGA